MFTYYYSILAVLLIGLVCALIIRRAHKQEGSELVGTAAKRLGGQLKASKRTGKVMVEDHSSDKLAWAERDKKHRLIREIDSVRTPWGWPKPSAEKGMLNLGLSEAMKSFSDRLVSRKSRLGNRTAKPRAKESIRAVIEERYVSTTWNSNNEIKYRKVKRPLLRDPNAQQDQMDDFGIKQAELVRKKLQRVVAMNADAVLASKRDELRYVGLKDVKQPWGW